MQLTDEHNKVIVGLHILKSRSGKTADMLIYINGVKVYAEEIDISYANKYFGVSGVQTSTIIKSGSKISFDIGGFKKTFSNSDIANVLIKNITFMFEKYGTSAQLSWNGVYWIKFIKNNCDTWIDIPNKFTANDILIADCKEGKIYLKEKKENKEYRDQREKPEHRENREQMEQQAKHHISISSILQFQNQQVHLK